MLGSTSDCEDFAPHLLALLGPEGDPQLTALLCLLAPVMLSACGLDPQSPSVVSASSAAFWASAWASWFVSQPAGVLVFVESEDELYHLAAGQVDGLLPEQGGGPVGDVSVLFWI